MAMDAQSAAGRANRQLVVRMMSQVVDGVRFLHSQNVAHRDLKPQNVLLDAALNVKVNVVPNCCARVHAIFVLHSSAS